MTRVIKYLFFVSLFLSIIIDFLIPQTHSHSHYWWDKLPGFDSLYGFGGCIFIIVVAKTLEKYWLQKREGYYD